jgi:hypothetical protein
MITRPTLGEAARSARRRRNIKLAGLPALGANAPVDSDQPIALVCECRRVTCGAQVSLPEALFRALVEEAEFWLVAPGHAGPNEHVVASSAGYQLIVPRSYVVELEPALAD